MVHDGIPVGGVLAGPLPEGSSGCQRNKAGFSRASYWAEHSIMQYRTREPETLRSGWLFEEAHDLLSSPRLFRKVDGGNQFPTVFSHADKRVGDGFAVAGITAHPYVFARPLAWSLFEAQNKLIPLCCFRHGFSVLRNHAVGDHRQLPNLLEAVFLVRFRGFFTRFRVPGSSGKAKSSLVVIRNFSEMISSVSKDGALIPRSMNEMKSGETPNSSENSSCVIRFSSRKSRRRSPNCCRREDTISILS